MRNILGPVIAAGLLLSSANAARAQVAPGEPVVVTEGPVLGPTLPPSIYAASVLPESLSHPYVMVPRFATAATPAAGIGYGNRFSPYGVYSRYAYYATGPFPAISRPYARFEKPCKHEKCRDCP